ncbi:hypothetical protein ACFL47_00965 [Candidatus Latescibacterota bacterium]
MNRHEKIACFNLVVIAFTVLLYFVLLYTIDAEKATVAMAVCALIAYGPRLFSVEIKDDSKKRFDSWAYHWSFRGSYDMDERDLAIHLTSIRNVFASFILFFTFGLLLLSYYNGLIIGSSSITIDNRIIRDIAIGSLILMFFVHSITTVILYRQGKEDE